MSEYLTNTEDLTTVANAIRAQLAAMLHRYLTK